MVDKLEHGKATTKEAEKDPKKRIIEAAVKLFAKQCYAGTGMRELAQEADVNLAMINYYFGGKHKILEAIIMEHFKTMEDMVRECFTGDAQPEEKLRRYIRELVAYMRVNRDIAFVNLAEIPYQMPELDNIRVSMLNNIRAIVEKELIPNLRSLLQRPFRVEIVITAISGLVFFHFIMHPIIEKFVGAPLDDAFYDEFVEEITNLALYGLIGRDRSATDCVTPTKKD